MTSNREMITCSRPPNDRVRVGGDHFLEAECYGSLSLLLHSPGGGITLLVKILDVAYIPELGFNPYS